MNRWFNAEAFFDRLVFWTVCGTLCAAPSFVWARLAGFDAPALVLGTVGYILLFSLVTSSPRYTSGMGASLLGRRLRVATLIRTGMAVLGLIGIGVLFAGFEHPALFFFSFIDWGAGTLAVGLTEMVSGSSLERGGSTRFGWTLFTTLVQGALVSAQLFTITLLSLVFPERKRGNRLSGLPVDAPL